MTSNLATIPASSLPARLLGAALFSVLLVVSVVAFLELNPPKPLPFHPVPFSGYDIKPMREAMAPAMVQKEFDAISAMGSRFPGTDGFLKVQDHIRKAYEDANLEIFEQSVEYPAPKTIDRRILDENGSPLDSVEIYPYLPNYFQAIVTPDEGVTGKLTLVTDDLILNGSNFGDKIAVIDSEKPPASTQLAWYRYAQLGFKAVILANREGLEKVKWPSTAGMLYSTPLNYVRIAAGPKIYDHLDHVVTLHVRARWVPVTARTLIGVLHTTAPAPVPQGIVVTSTYDSCSILPDFGPGDLNAMSVATQLATLKGMVKYRDQLKRDVIFVSYGSQFMGHVAVDRLVATLGPGINPLEAEVEIKTQIAENAKTLAAVKEVSAICADEQFLAVPTDPAKAAAAADKTVELINRLNPDAKAWLGDQIRYVLDTIGFELLENVLQTRIADIRNRIEFKDKDKAREDDKFPAYQKAKRDLDEAAAASGYPPEKLLRERARVATIYDVRGRFIKRTAEALALHTKRDADFNQNLKIHDAFTRYQSIAAISAYLTPALETKPDAPTPEVVSFFVGLSSSGTSPETTFNDMYSLATNDILSSMSQRFPEIKVKFDGYKKNHSIAVAPALGSLHVDTGFWTQMGWPAFSMVNTNRSDAYGQIGNPFTSPGLQSTKSMEGSLDFFGQTALSMAFGNGTYPPARKNTRRDFGGTIYASNVGKSIVPNYPLAGSMVGGRLYYDSGAGFYRYPILITDMYGKWYMPFNTVDYVDGWNREPEAVALDSIGRVTWIKDQGSSGQAIYKSMNMPGVSASMNMVAFRATPVSLMDLINPQTLKTYTGVGFMGRDSHADISRINTWSSGVISTSFIEPDTRFFVKLQSGAAGNDITKTTRAFILGVDRNFKADPQEEIEGNGFLASDTPYLLDVPGQVARSMLMVNGKRLALQDKFGMVDQRTKDFAIKSETLLEAAEAHGISDHAAILDRRDAVTYAQINHPVLRDSISEAIGGVIFYLALLVPFVFFFEKLVFGYTDIRKQIFAQSIIFVVVFVLLWILHPAFEMIRSPAMILLGFVILMISLGVTLLFSSKFGENLEEIRKKQGKVSAANASTSGVVGTAFLLGLNNMHRRKVRTGLTCATLVLMTFAMICFAGVQSNVVSVATAVGKASYQGLLIQREKFAPIDSTELYALVTKYSYKFTVAPRYMLTGVRTWDQIRHSTEMSMSYTKPGAAGRKIDVSSILRFAPDEPLRGQIKLLTNKGWFTKAMVQKKGPPPILLPEKLAKELGITAEQVNTSDVIVKVKESEMLVQGIFDSNSLADLRDLDGTDLLPMDVEATDTREIEVSGSPQFVLTPKSAPRLPAERILIASSDIALPFGLTKEGLNYERLVSVAVSMPHLGYKQAREQIDDYLEQTGNQASFGLDGVAYLGRRSRTGSFDGLFDMIIPLIIAAMTVLNTMNGSVYERKDEIFVYNAVGIAPRYIFFMFIAEAFVYAIVGSILGYILSQATGKILTLAHLTGGLNMTFTSYMTILASVLIMMAVFISTIAPGIAAMRIAAPSDDSGWKLPKAEGDVMSFYLPFTFDWRDRVAILAFFNRYFLDHGEGSAGQFYSADPVLRVEPDTSANAVDDQSRTIPEITAIIWLKPFDLGVSHRVTIAFPRDPETGEYIAHITLNRISGTRDSWLRLSQGFVGLLRRHFLHWRAVSVDQKTELFDEARTMLVNTEEVSA